MGASSWALTKRSPRTLAKTGWSWSKFFKKQLGRLVVRTIVGIVTGGISELAFLGADLVSFVCSTKDLFKATKEASGAMSDVSGMAQAAAEDGVISYHEAREITTTAADPAMELHTAAKEFQSTVGDIMRDGRTQVSGKDVQREVSNHFVIVPDGVGPGDKIHYSTDEGDRFVECPPGVGPGMRVWVD